MNNIDIDRVHAIRQENLSLLLDRLPGIDVARAASVTPAYISQIKNGKRAMTSGLAIEIENGLGLPAGWLSKTHLDLRGLTIRGPQVDEPSAIPMHGDDTAEKEKMALKVRNAIQYSDYATALFTTVSLCLDEMVPTQRRYVMDWVAERFDLNGMPRGQSKKLHGPKGSDDWSRDAEDYVEHDAQKPWDLGDRRTGEKQDTGERRRSTDGEQVFIKLFHDGGYGQ